MNFWTSLQPKTKMTIVIVIGVIIVVSMVTGNFDVIVSIFKG